MTDRITVLGTGYLGATHATCLADLGFDVLGMDIDAEKIAALSSGRLPFYEPDLEPLLRKHVELGNLRFTTSYAEAATFGEVHFLCVGTPQRKGDDAADLAFLDAAVDGLAEHLERECLVVGKSTVPVGTAQRLAKRIVDRSPAGPVTELAWNPEFLREGHAVEDTVRPERLVVGVPSERAERVLREVYAKPIAAGTPFLVTDLPTAELVKTAANAFLATKISFINAMSELCECAGADVVRLADAIGYDSRIGRQFLDAGLGFGGGCLPKDIRGFMARAAELGAGEALQFLREVDAINLRRRTHVVDLAREACDGSLAGMRVGVLGAAFKPNSDDVRDSPALAVAGQIGRQGAQVTVYDPRANDNARRVFPALAYTDSAVEACTDAQVVLHLTDWREFRTMDPTILDPVVAQKYIVDGRNALDADVWRRAGWTYRGLGRA